MHKFFAVVKHEYKKIVLKWTFLIGTLLFPLVAAVFAFVPAIIFSIKSEPTRLAIIDPTGKIAPRLRESLLPEKIAERAQQVAQDSFKNLTLDQEEKIKSDLGQLQSNFRFVEVDLQNKTLEQVLSELTFKIQQDELDAYLIVPGNYSDVNARYEFLSRKSGDFITNETLKDALDNAVRSQRLADANISEEQVKNLSRKVIWEVKKLDETGAETSEAGGFVVGFLMALVIYLILTVYGQTILSAVVEEKETRIAEILFSSARPFELMMGKLVGVGLAGLTQFGIWIISASVLLALAIPSLKASGMGNLVPNITSETIVYLLIFFVLGFFLYGSVFALIGSMVPTVQEGGQFSFLPVLLMLAGFYFSLAVIRDPNSALAIWTSIVPFLAPMTMPVRIIQEMPPFWQLGLSILVNSLVIVGMVWLASRVYRIGMLMYGKRPTIPEVWKWIRQS